MFYRDKFSYSIHFLYVFLILSSSQAFPADAATGWIISMAKTVGEIALKAITAGAVGSQMTHYENHNRISERLNNAKTNSITISTGTVRDEGPRGLENTNEGKSSTLSLDRTIALKEYKTQLKEKTDAEIELLKKQKEEIVKSARSEVDYRKRKKDKAVLKEAEESLEFWQQALADTEEEINFRNKSKELQKQAATTLVQATAMILTSQTTGTQSTQTTKVEEVPQSTSIPVPYSKTAISYPLDPINPVKVIKRNIEKNEEKIKSLQEERNGLETEFVQLMNFNQEFEKEFEEKKKNEQLNWETAERYREQSFLNQCKQKELQSDIKNLDKEIALQERKKEETINHFNKVIDKQTTHISANQKENKGGGGSGGNNNNDDEDLRQKDIQLQYPKNKSQIDHIFRNERGHIAALTEGAREILQEAYENGVFHGVDKFGNYVYSYINPKDGNQIWIQLRENGLIKNCGANIQHWVWNATTQTLKAPDNYIKPLTGVWYAVTGFFVANEATASQPEVTPNYTEPIQKKKKQDLMLEKYLSGEIQLKDTFIMQDPILQKILEKERKRVTNMSFEELQKEAMKPLWHDQSDILGNKKTFTNVLTFKEEKFKKPMFEDYEPKSLKYEPTPEFSAKFKENLEKEHERLISDIQNNKSLSDTLAEMPPLISSFKASDPKMSDIISDFKRSKKRS